MRMCNALGSRGGSPSDQAVRCRLGPRGHGRAKESAWPLLSEHLRVEEPAGPTPLTRRLRPPSTGGCPLDEVLHCHPRPRERHLQVPIHHPRVKTRHPRAEEGVFPVLFMPMLPTPDLWLSPCRFFLCFSSEIEPLSGKAGLSLDWALS